ncbi:NADH dehydrogenase [ubiquinone] flavoprotein 3, mitochondrial isoform X1 [Empidonax traillii]|uniref:NADH dehydrogenase [ubiquinone] flavoprotein 3, mitochondrial isoform X1 n=1 Tax=Empidonax traillii TaxID=164674 RepID=UPI000FFD079B|nr:NADH dehydrogenase [ubiquinone] flavoprotein 3, mitochondrial isoform X1 [Empidonax traillii]
MAAAAALRGGGRAATRQVLRLEARGLCTKPNKPTGTAAPPKIPPGCCLAGSGCAGSQTSSRGGFPSSCFPLLFLPTLHLPSDREKCSGTTGKHQAACHQGTR